MVHPLPQLSCPSCGGVLGFSPTASDSAFTVLACYCGAYPVVDGIPILKKGPVGTNGETTDQLLDWIRTGQHQRALLALISPSSPSLAPQWARSLPSIMGIRRLRRILHHRELHRWTAGLMRLVSDCQGKTTACDLFDLYFGSNRRAYDYFAFRFGQPRHLVSLSFLSLINKPARPILELACGFGHLTWSLIQRSDGQPVVGIDTNFFALFVAKNWMAPTATYICCDADQPLPFRTSAFSAVFCSDAFHYVANKIGAIRELKRVAGTDGLLLLASMRNALVKQMHNSLSLPPDGYRALVEDMPHCLLGDNSILARYLKRQGPLLARSVVADDAAQDSLVSMVASKREDIFRDHGTFESWPHAQGKLGINPLFRQERWNGSKELFLRRTFPGDYYEAENAECKQYLPEAVRISAAALTELSSGKEHADEIAKLIGQFVVLGMPERPYSKTSG